MTILAGQISEIIMFVQYIPGRFCFKILVSSRQQLLNNCHFKYCGWDTFYCNQCIFTCITCPVDNCMKSEAQETDEKN